MSFTLTTLTASIKEWTENDESTFVAEIPFFITNAEERILKSVDLDYFRKNVTGTMTSGNKFLQKPSDYLATHSLSFVNASSENVFLLQKDVNFIQMGQKANIIITAYDATIYGKIIGEVSTIGINTLLDEMYSSLASSFKG